MSFSIATHTDTRWAIGCYALTALAISLLSMVLPWVSLGVLVLLIWSTWTEKQGHVGWFRSWIPKQRVDIQIDWKEMQDETKPSLIHFYMDTRDHWWIQSALVLQILTVFCWACVFMGWVTLAFSILPVLCIVGIVRHRSGPDTGSTSTEEDGIQIFAPAEITWYGLQLFFEQHQTMLSKTGTVVIHSQASTIPIQLPTGFDNWTIKHSAA